MTNFDCIICHNATAEIEDSICEPCIIASGEDTRTVSTDLAYSGEYDYIHAYYDEVSDMY